MEDAASAEPRAHAWCVLQGPQEFIAQEVSRIGCVCDQSLRTQATGE